MSNNPIPLACVVTCGPNSNIQHPRFVFASIEQARAWLLSKGLSQSTVYFDEYTEPDRPFTWQLQELNFVADLAQSEGQRWLSLT